MLLSHFYLFLYLQQKPTLHCSLEILAIADFTYHSNAFIPFLTVSFYIDIKLLNYFVPLQTLFRLISNTIQMLSFHFYLLLYHFDNCIPYNFVLLSHL
ncbi:hypothetical protein C1645_481805 [Glomus cerebriforme]|uniref:Uncharacterized protein n=1 Tax=Glomus cerebriforme TaxID=658196 RepID=A0A397S9R2_9GLOM|nr:hypothetical protein C1645_481805 [Glomus cerebriforme]